MIFWSGETIWKKLNTPTNTYFNSVQKNTQKKFFSHAIHNNSTYRTFSIILQYENHFKILFLKTYNRLENYNDIGRNFQ